MGGVAGHQLWKKRARWLLFFIVFLKCSNHSYHLAQVWEKFKKSFYSDGIILNEFVAGFYPSLENFSRWCCGLTHPQKQRLKIQIIWKPFLKNYFIDEKNGIYLKHFIYFDFDDEVKKLDDKGE